MKLTQLTMWSAFVLGIVAMAALGASLTYAASGNVDAAWRTGITFVACTLIAITQTSRVMSANRSHGTAHHMFR